MQEATNVPLADRVVLRPQQKDTFDLTSARIFLETPEYQKRVVHSLKEFYPNHTVEGKKVCVGASWNGSQPCGSIGQWHTAPRFLGSIGVCTCSLPYQLNGGTHD